jgi:hypothetical protein
MKGVCGSIKKMLIGGEYAVRRRRYSQEIFSDSSHR